MNPFLREWLSASELDRADLIKKMKLSEYASVSEYALSSKVSEMMSDLITEYEEMKNENHQE
ncbi:MAG: hypothetical protein M0T81_01210 [Thermoplasmatales archaeon]|nr:hypothetical protein [Thermoplasmatales archaeon]